MRIWPGLPKPSSGMSAAGQVSGSPVVRSRSASFGYALAGLAGGACALTLGLWMLLLNAGFRPAWNAGIPPWGHSLAGVLLLAIGGASIVWAVVRALRTARRMVLIGVAGAVTLGILGWFGWDVIRPVPAIPDGSRSASRYLADALWYLERYYVDREHVNWDMVRTAALQRAKGAQTAADTYESIREALRQAGDLHGVLLPANWRASVRPATSVHPSVPPLLRIRMPEGRRLGAGVAYVVLPARVGPPDTDVTYVLKGRQTLSALDGQATCGWIVDLRGNLGGNVWPMLDAMAPLLWEGLLGGLTMPQLGRTIHWWMVNGRASDTAVMLAIPSLQSSRVPVLNGRESPMAVLISHQTASSGEAMATVLRGRAQTRLFGESSAGMASALQSVALADGSELLITIGHDVDRHGRVYAGPLVPDERGGGDMDTADTSDTVRQAQRWLSSQCSAR